MINEKLILPNNVTELDKVIEYYRNTFDSWYADLLEYYINYHLLFKEKEGYEANSGRYSCT